MSIYIVPLYFSAASFFIAPLVLSHTNKTKTMALTLPSKLVIISTTTILSTAIILKFSILQTLTNFAFTQLPILYTSLLSWLKPPYLYLLTNCIIISIIASSKLHLPNSHQPIFPPDSSSVPDKVSGSVSPERSGSLEFLFEDLVEEKEEEKKPLVSERFCHSKSLKGSTEGQQSSPGVAKPKREETLESTWKMVTDGHAIPLNRHLKKSDTWATHVNRKPTEDKMLVKKPESLNGTKKMRSSNDQWKLRREPSLSQDELNRRVEAFIKKFNEEMRLQRQQSLDQYQEMITRAREVY